jgi:hypothetical protein
MSEERPEREADEPGFDRPGDAGEPLSEDHEPAETEDAPGGPSPGNPPQREQPGL